MNLSDDDALSRLSSHDHGILCTLHSRRGVDAVPVAYAVEDGHLAVPVDRVKAKSSLRLQRERNLEADPRATVLVENWDAADWSRLWWVRAELRWQPEPGSERVSSLSAILAARSSQYVGQPFAKVIVFEILGVAGWAAGEA